MNGAAVPGSLSEGAAERSEVEGVSSDGCFGPMVYEPAHIGSEIFERLRSSRYTPSVSRSLDSSLREGAGRGAYHSSGYSLKSGVTGDFHRPYATLNVWDFTIHRGTLPQSRIRSTALSGREPGLGLYHSTGYSLTSGVTGDFHRPYEAQKILGGYHSTCRSETGRGRAIFIAPTKTQNILHSTIQRAARKAGGGGRFSSPLRRLRIFYIPPYN